MKFHQIADMHCHLREAKMLQDVFTPSVSNRSYVVAMPNLQVPLFDSRYLEAYKSYINALYPLDLKKILFTLYLSPSLTPIEIEKAKPFGIKLYPQSMTTNSEYGISKLDLIELKPWFLDVLEYMQGTRTVLMVHAEMPGESCLDSEDEMIPVIKNIAKRFPRLKISVEHVTDYRMIDYITTANMYEGKPIVGTITLHHLFLTIDSVVGQNLNYCRPVAKTFKDRLTLQHTIGKRCFFLGSDSAPHYGFNKLGPQHACAGCYTAPYLIENLYQFFDEQKLLGYFEAFTYNRAAVFYNLEERGEYFEIEESEPYIPFGLIANNIYIWNAYKELNFKIKET